MHLLLTFGAVQLYFLAVADQNGTLACSAITGGPLHSLTFT